MDLSDACLSDMYERVDAVAGEIFWMCWSFWIDQTQRNWSLGPWIVWIYMRSSGQNMSSFSQALLSPFNSKQKQESCRIRRLVCGIQSLMWRQGASNLAFHECHISTLILALKVEQFYPWHQYERQLLILWYVEFRVYSRFCCIISEPCRVHQLDILGFQKRFLFALKRLAIITGYKDIGTLNSTSTNMSVEHREFLSTLTTQTFAAIATKS